MLHSPLPAKIQCSTSRQALHCLGPVLLLSAVSYNDFIDQSVKQQGNVSDLPGAKFIVRTKY